MKYFQLKLIFFHILFEISFPIIWTQEITFYVVEENKNDLILGNINYFLENQMKTDPKSAEFHFSSKYISIDNVSKNVRMKQVVDVDTICSTDSECCDQDICVIKTKILLQEHNQYKATFLLKLEIKDLDDNYPVFNEEKKIISLSEKIPVNTSISIEGAIDKDFSKENQEKIYQFFDSTETFELSNPHFHSLSIFVRKRLDYETKEMFNCLLKVCDRKYQNCANKSIIIKVKDENDNDPVFERKSYFVKIPENFQIGKEILKVTAKDIDGVGYNRTKYGFQSEYNIMSVFKIDEQSGAISLINNLSINKKSKYNFKVYAMDASFISFKKDYTEVEINVEDVNDNYPLISLLNGPMPNLYLVDIEENIPPKTLFSIQVTDKDLGNNSIVACSLNTAKDDLIKMVKIDLEIYQINTQNLLDYETIQTIEGEILCSDSGIPSLLSRKQIQINIIDVNEYEPEIKNSPLIISLKENIPENKYVMNIDATDSDRGAVLTYYLDESSKVHFSIDSQTGKVLTTNNPLDKETNDSVKFKVIVTDSLKNPYTATVVITVNILDQNDNAPQFIHVRPFVVYENQFIYTKLTTKIEANDADKEELNRSIIFRLLHTFNCHMEMIHDQVFDVNWLGEIETVALIDREKDNNYTLTILAQDRGNPPFSNSINITITIQDINDNAPVWIYPYAIPPVEPEATINVSRDATLGTVIANLKASDQDLDDAGKVGYLILSSDTYHRNGHFLLLNETTGTLSISQYPLIYGRNQLRIRAHDHGQPQLYTDATLIINVMQSNDNLFSGLNMAIIIGMLSITALISLFLVIAIFFIRRSPNPPRNHRLSSQNIRKDCESTLKNSYKDLDEFPEKIDSVFTDNDCHHVYYRNGNSETNLPMYPQSSVEGLCPTYVRFATPGSFLHEMDGESADSGKGTSDLDVAHQTNMKASSTNLYGSIQLIPSNRVKYYAPNKALRNSYQVINEAEQIYNPEKFHQQTLSHNLQNPGTIPNLCSYQTLSFNSLPPYNS